MLLYVEKQVPTITGRVEVRNLAQPLELSALVADGQILAKSPNVIGRACITACGNEFTHLDHVPAGKFAIETQFHESSGPQSRQQCSPSRERVAQMMQYSDRFDDVERARDATELQNIGLCILNVRYAQLLRLSFGITDA